MKKIFDLWEHRKWTLYLYYNGVLIAKKRIKENEAPAEHGYVCMTHFKKKIFGSNRAGVIVRPIRLLKNDENKKRTYWGTTFETGIEI